MHIISLRYKLFIFLEHKSSSTLC